MDVRFGLVPRFLSFEEVDGFKGRLPELDGQARPRSLLDHEWCRALASDPKMLGLAETLMGTTARH